MNEKPHLPPQNSNSPTGLPIEYPGSEYFAAREQERLADVAQKTAEQQATYRQEDEAKKRKRIKRGMKAVFAATVMVAAAKSGGLVDMAADPFANSADIAADAIKNQPTEAEQTVVELFERVDKDGYQGIVAEVEAEKRSNLELFVSTEVATQAKEAIDDADGNVAALAALDHFMAEYNIKAEFIAEPFTHNTAQFKKALNAHIDVFSVLPKDLVAMSKLKAVTLSAESSYSHNADGTLHGGTYYPDDNFIELVVRTEETDGQSSRQSFIDGNDRSYQSKVAHELGHALDEQLHLQSQLSDSEITFDKADKEEASNDIFWQNIIDRPDHISTYSLSSTDEHTAEVLSGVLSDSTNGLAAVENTRLFGSGASRYMIDMLAQLEATRPGIAKILIANRVS